LKILLVDDDRDSGRFLTKLLLQSGHEPNAATNISEAVELATSNRFDLLIADIGLPDGDGRDLLRQLRTMYPIRGIVLSGFEVDEAQRSQLAGFCQHITKPVDIEQLLEVINGIASDGDDQANS
jgi:CheY-like chemotaxis protein